MLVLAACAPQVAPSAADPAPNQTQWPKASHRAGLRIATSSPCRWRSEGSRSKPSGKRASSRMAAGGSRRIRPACHSRSTRYRHRRSLYLPTPSHITGGIPGSMGRCLLPAVRFSWSMVFTISITMMGSTTVVSGTAASETAVFTEAGGERQALLQCRPREAFALRPLAVVALQERSAAPTVRASQRPTSSAR